MNLHVSRILKSRINLYHGILREATKPRDRRGHSKIVTTDSSSGNREAGVFGLVAPSRSGVVTGGVIGHNHRGPQIPRPFLGPSTKIFHFQFYFIFSTLIADIY